MIRKCTYRCHSARVDIFCDIIIEKQEAETIGCRLHGEAMPEIRFHAMNDRRETGFD